MNVRKFSLLAATAAVATCGALGAATAHARSEAPVDVQWSVTIGSPAVMLPAPPRIVQPVVVTAPQPVIVAHAPPVVLAPAPRGYREPTRWDVDGDGIPNRHDRSFNPVWDQNGNGIPDRREFRHRPDGDRDHDGVPNRYDRYDNRVDNRFDNRFDDRRPFGYPR